MLRTGGAGLTRHESRLLAAALKLAAEGVEDLYGYEVFAQLVRWEGAPPMNHGTVYRCLRALHEGGYLSSGELQHERHPGRARIYYRLTPLGVEAGRKATIRFAGENDPPTWIDVTVNPSPRST